MDVPWSTILLNCIFILALVLLNGFFVASEFALVKVRGTRIAQLSDEGNPRAKKTLILLKDIDAYLSATQLGITFSSLALGWVGEPFLFRMLEPLFKMVNLPDTSVHILAFTFAFGIISFLHIVLGEITPKSIAIRKAESTALLISMPLKCFFVLFKPAIWALNSMSNQILKFFNIELVVDHQHAHTEEEIRMLVVQSHKSGMIDQTELSLFDNIFDFNERIGREIMVPRTNMICIYKDDELQANLDTIRKSHFTRFPLCGQDKDDILGIIHIRDLYERMTQGETPILIDIARPTVMLPETMEIKDILRTLQKNRTEIAIVVDEYGGTSGLITIEDIVEELVGEIQDEFDDEEPDFELKENNATSIDSQLLIEEINEHFSLDIEDEDNDTIGGWVFSKLQKIPKIGAFVEYKNYKFTVVEMNQRSITRILVTEKDKKLSSK